MRSITTPHLAAQLIGRKVLSVALQPFDDGRGGVAFDPVLLLDDGSELSFSVQETETGTYGVRVDRSSPAKWTTKPARKRRR